MRIYEIAREAGVTSVEVLKAAEAAGMEATSAISSVDADAHACCKRRAGASRACKDRACGDFGDGNACCARKACHTHGSWRKAKARRALERG